MRSLRCPLETNTPHKTTLDTLGWIQYLSAHGFASWFVTKILSVSGLTVDWFSLMRPRPAGWIQLNTSLTHFTYLQSLYMCINYTLFLVGFRFLGQPPDGVLCWKEHRSGCRRCCCCIMGRLTSCSEQCRECMIPVMSSRGGRRGSPHRLISKFQVN